MINSNLYIWSAVSTDKNDKNWCGQKNSLLSSF